MFGQKPIRDDKWKIWFSFPSYNNLANSKTTCLEPGLFLSQMKDCEEREARFRSCLRELRSVRSEDEEMSSVITLASTGHK